MLSELGIKANELRENINKEIDNIKIEPIRNEEYNN